MNVITVAAVILTTDDGEILTVRKSGTTAFMLPGGKPEAGETAVDTARREIHEELGLHLSLAQLQPLGHFSSRAANEAHTRLEATVFQYTTPIRRDQVEAKSEIAELRWLSRDAVLQVAGSATGTVTAKGADDTGTGTGDTGIGCGTGSATQGADGADARLADQAPLNTDEVFPALRGRRRFAVYTGSAIGHDTVYADAARELIAGFARHGDSVIYGGGKVGLMGVVGDTAIAEGVPVVGIIPTSLTGGEVQHAGLTRIEVVDSMSARKDRMAQLSDVMIALPGGIGTLDEFFDVWVGQHLGSHHNPVVLYNVDGCWDELIALLDSLVDRGFLRPDLRATLIVADGVEDLYAQLAQWTPPPPKWR